MRHPYEQTPTCEANPYAPYRPLHRNRLSSCAHHGSARRLLKSDASASSAAGRARSGRPCRHYCARANYRISAGRARACVNCCARAYGRSRNANYRAGPYHSARSAYNRADHSTRAYRRAHCAYNRICAYNGARRPNNRRVRIRRACVHAWRRQHCALQS